MSLPSLVIPIFPPRPSSSTGHIYKSFMGFFLSWPEQSLSQWKTITQAVNMLQCLFQSTPILQQTVQHTQIFHKNQSESQKKSSICNTSTDRCLLKHQQTSAPCPLTVSPCKAAQQGVYPDLITFDFLHLLKLSQASQGKASSLWLCCFSSSQNPRAK